MADGYISQIKTPDNKVYLLKDSEKTDEKVKQTSNTEDKEFPILFKNANNATEETAGVKYSGNITTDATTTKPFTFNPSTGNLTVTQLKIGTKNDNMGIFPNLNNWNQIGSSALYWYRSYINNYYGGRSHVDNWDSGKNIGIAASSSAAAVLGTVNFYNTAAAGATQTKTLLTADSTTNSNITVTLPKTTGTLALKSELPTLSGLSGIGTISASGTAPLTLSGSKSGTTYTLTGSIADASASASGIVNTDAQTFSGVKTFDNGLHIYGTISTQGTGSAAGTMYPGGAYHSGHNSIILHGDTAGVSGIGFTSEKATKSGTTTNINGSSDRAFIQYHAYGVTPAAEGTAPTLATSGELGTLVIGVGNDATDTIRLQAPGTAGILHQIGATAYPIPHTTNTNGSVGGTTTPVYVDAGVIKAGTALGTASQKAESYFVKAITSTDNAIARFNGTSGQVQNSGVIINDSNNIITTGEYIETAGGRLQYVQLLPGIAWSNYAADTWYRCCKITSKHYYINGIIQLSGNWSTGAPTMATVSIQMRSTYANITLLQCAHVGIIKSMRLVYSDSSWWLDVQVNIQSSGNCGVQSATFIGNIVASDINTALTATTDTTAPAATLHFKTKYNDDTIFKINNSINILDTTASTTTSTGALLVSGGAGIDGRVTAQEFNATRQMVLSAGKVYSNISGSNVLLPAKTTAMYANGIAIANPGLTAANDVGWIRALGTAETDMVLEIATGDDGGSGEQIVARQYNTSNAIAHEAVLLDKTGATSFPVSVTAPSFSGSGASLTSLNASNLASGTVPVARLPLATTSAAGAVKVGSGISVSDGTISVTAGNLGLSGALRYQGTTTTAMSDGLTTATVKINNADFTPSAGDVVIYNDAEYLWTGSLWELIGAESSFKKVQTAVSSSSASGNSATTFVSSVTQDTQGVITVKTSTLNTSGTWSGTATKASYPEGFSSRSTNATWGNQTGATVTCWNESDGGSIDIRKNNPSSGKVSIKVDGRFYGNEGNNPAMLMSDPNNTSYWGMGNPDGSVNVWIRTTSLGIIPFQSGGASAGHGGIGTSSWYFASSYIQNMYGNHTGNVTTSSITHIDGGSVNNGSWTTGATGTAPTATTTDGTTTYSGATIGTSILTLGNNKVGGNSASGVANNSQGILRLYSSGSAYGELTGYTTGARTHIHASTGISLPENIIDIMFRPGSSSYYTHIAYETSGNEALVAATQNAVTSFIFVNGESYANVAADRWTKLTGASGAGNAPGLQIKQNCVSIGELIPSGTNATYKLKVAGTSYFTKPIISTLTPSGWIDGQRYANGAVSIADYSNTGSYNPWMRATNTWASGAENAKVGRWFSFGTLGTSFYWMGSVSTRTENSYDNALRYDTSNGYLYAAAFNGNLNGQASTVARATFGDSGNGEHNANNIKSNGLWYYTSNGPATTLGASTGDGAIYSQAYSTSWVGQIAQDYRDGALFVRGLNSGTWKNWYAIPKFTTTTGGLGGATQPVYIDTNGELQVCTAYSSASVNYATSAGGVAWSNVSGRPTNVSSFTNDAGYLTSYTETDPTVPAWAKASSKPSYTASEVGALASSTVVTNVAISADTTTNKNYALVFGTTPSDGTTPTGAKTEGLQKNIAKLYVNPSTGNIQAETFNGYTLAAASAKSVVTSIDASASLPTSNAVKTFVEGKGYVTSSDITTAINALDGTITGSGSATKTITALSQTNGKVSATFSDIAFPVSSVAGLSGTITANNLTEALGLSKALRFVGITTTDMTGTTATNHTYTGKPAGISDYTPAVGDVVINNTKQDEWVCIAVSGTTYTWERLGSDTSYKIVQSAVSDPTAASTTSTTFIDTISQNANGVISATKKTLPTASTSVAGIIKIGTASTNAMAGNTTVTNVAFTAATDDKEYPILLKNSTGSTTTAASAKFANTTNKMTTINPSTGMITAPSLTLASNAATAHLAFARAGWNYVTMPNNDSSVISIGYGTQADNTTQRLVIYKTGTVRPGANGSQNLGDDTHKWNKVYGVNFYGTFNGTSTSAQQLAAREIDNSDLNQFSSGGALKYAWVSGGNNILPESKPTGVNAFGVIAMKTAASWTGQLLMSTDSEPGLYWRTNLTTETPSYGSWTPLASGNGGVYYGTCETAADVVEKVVVCKHYHTLKAGDIIVVTFTNSNTQAQPTLNVNNTGAVSVKMAYSGGIVDLGSTSQLRFTCTFIYDGTYWLIINQQNAIQLATSDGNLNWRSVLLSDSNSINENFTPTANTLGRTYAAHNVKYQPSTGTLRAPIMKTPKVQIEYDHVNKAHIEWNDTDSSIDFIFD